MKAKRPQYEDEDKRALLLDKAIELGLPVTGNENIATLEIYIQSVEADFYDETDLLMDIDNETEKKDKKNAVTTMISKLTSFLF